MENGKADAPRPRTGYLPPNWLEIGGGVARLVDKQVPCLNCFGIGPLEKLDWHHVTFSESVKKEVQYANRRKNLPWCGEGPDQPLP